MKKRKKRVSPNRCWCKYWKHPDIKSRSGEKKTNMKASIRRKLEDMDSQESNGC